VSVQLPSGAHAFRYLAAGADGSTSPTPNRLEANGYGAAHSMVVVA
jgi:hypothetical protein